MVPKKDLPECPVATTVGLVGNKWKLLILRDILAGPQRFGRLQRSLAGISAKVLTESLRAMEADGIIIRTVYPASPPVVEYSLSPVGESLRPLIAEMERWGMAYRALADAEASPVNLP